jgi:hypothetical protein
VVHHLWELHADEPRRGAGPVEEPIQEQALQQPIRINCATADGNIRMLQYEKAHVVQHIALGITAIYPAGMVMGVLMGTEQTKLQVATGDYNNMIDQRIADIKMTCGLP